MAAEDGFGRARARAPLLGTALPIPALLTPAFLEPALLELAPALLRTPADGTALPRLGEFGRLIAGPLRPADEALGVKERLGVAVALPGETERLGADILIEPLLRMLPALLPPRKLLPPRDDPPPPLNPPPPVRPPPVRPPPPPRDCAVAIAGTRQMMSAESRYREDRGLLIGRPIRHWPDGPAPFNYVGLQNLQGCTPLFTGMRNRSPFGIAFLQTAADFIRWRGVAKS